MSRFLLLLLLLATILTLTECQVYSYFVNVIDKTSLYNNFSMFALFSWLRFSVLDSFLRRRPPILPMVDRYHSFIVKNLIWRSSALKQIDSSADLCVYLIVTN